MTRDMYELLTSIHKLADEVEADGEAELRGEAEPITGQDLLNIAERIRALIPEKVTKGVSL